MNARAASAAAAAPAVASTPKELLVRAGRMRAVARRWRSCWCAGWPAILEPEPASERAAGARRAAWPDEAARAFAVEFAAVYLDARRRPRSGRRAQRWRVRVSGDSADALAPRLDGQGRAQTVESVAVAGCRRGWTRGAR